MKRIIYLFVPVLVALTVLSSCKRDYDDDYMGNVDERLDAMLKSYEQTLVSSEHGWMANISTSEGIYRFWMKFYKNNGSDLNDLKGNRVIMISDNLRYDFSGVTDGKAVADTSSFRLKALQRPTLIFDTYSYLSIICDPDDDISGGSDNQGLETDFEYEIADYKDGRFTLVGRTHRVPATLEMATAEEEASAHSAEMVDVLKHLTKYVNSKYYHYVETENYGPVMIDFGQRLLGAFYVSTDGNSLTHTDLSTSYMSFGKDVIPTTPIEVSAGVTIEKLAWTGSKYEAVLANGQRLPVFESDQSPIPLPVWMGPEYNKEYNMLLIPPAWISGLYESNNPMGAYLTYWAQTIAAYNSNFDLYYFMMTFRKNADGTDYFEVKAYIAYRKTTLVEITYNFDLVWVTPGVFRLGNYSCPFDAYEFNTLFLQQGWSKPLLDAMAGQTYSMSWGPLLGFKDGTSQPCGIFQCKSDPDVALIGGVEKE